MARHTLNRMLLLVIASTFALAIGEIGLRVLNLANPPAFHADETYGYVMKPGQDVATRGYPFRINQAGFRGDEFSERPSAGVSRVAFVGDSITYGGGSIPEAELFVNQIGRDLEQQTTQPVEVVNMSVPGWGIANMAGYLDKNGAFDAQLLVWVISSADLRRPKTIMENHGFLETKPALRVFYMLHFLRRIVYRYDNEGWQESPENRSSNIELLRESLSKWRDKATLGVVFVPPRDESSSSKEDWARYVDALEELDVAYLDLLPSFQEFESAAMFIDPVHLSIQGHEEAAKLMLPFIGDRLSEANDSN